MFIPMQHSQVDAVPSPGVRLFDRMRPGRHSYVRPEYRLGEFGAGVFRAMVLLFGGINLAFGQGGEQPVAPLLIAALLVALLTLIGGFAARAPLWVALLGDGIAVGLLILATGGIASPFLVLVSALVIQGGLLGDERDAATGAGIGLLVLLASAVLGGADGDNLFLGVLAAHLAASVAAVWWIRQARRALSRLSEDAAQRARADQDSGDTRRVMEWQQQNLALVGASSSMTELAQRAQERAAAITGAPVTLDNAAGFAPRGWYVIPLTSADRLVIHQMSLDLNRPQREALDHLAAVVRQRVDALRLADTLRRHNDALMALWEVAGVLRAAPNLGSATLDACRRIAGALDLEWLAFLGLDEQQALTPLLLVRGRADGIAPRLHPADLRVAGEALRGGRSLVRTEQGVTLACLPVRMLGETSLVLVARGIIDEAALQAFLMVFGDLVAERLAADPALRIQYSAS